jgi:NitT/TauT family transport system substrate-binding protein
MLRGFAPWLKTGCGDRAAAVPVAVEKGEVQAYVAGDPNVYFQVKNSDGKLFRAASNLTNEFADRTCCVPGIRGNLSGSNIHAYL